MSNYDSGAHASTVNLVLVSGLITLAVTILRLVGELQHWSKLLFNPAAGGGFGLVGIVWLVPIFGIYFALKLAGAGAGPASAGKAIGFALLGLLVIAGGVVLLATSGLESLGMVIGGLILMVVAIAIQFAAWPSLAKALLAYGLAARIPVAIVVYFALRGNWGTHYDRLPPNFPPMSFWGKYVMAGLTPQLIMWVAFTVALGTALGGVAALLVRRKAAAPVAP